MYYIHLYNSKERNPKKIRKVTPYYFGDFLFHLLGFPPEKSPATATRGSLLHRGAGTSPGRLRGAENRGETDGYSG